MEPIFKLGEKVRVVKKEKNSFSYKYGFEVTMEDFSDKIVTIEKVIPDYNTNVCEIPDDNALYRIKEDNIKFEWASSMFEKYNPNLKCENNKENNEKHWQDVRERAAIAAMQGMLSCGEGAFSYSGVTDDIVKSAVEYADTIVKQLRGE